MWLHGTEEGKTQKCMDILTLDVPAMKYISIHEVLLVRPLCPCRRPPLTCTGVVVNFICRDSSLSILSFSLHNSQLFLRGVGVRQTSGTRLSLELNRT